MPCQQSTNDSLSLILKMFSFALLYKEHHFLLLNGHTPNQKPPFNTLGSASSRIEKLAHDHRRYIGKNLRMLQLNQGTLLQYVDDLLITSMTFQLGLETVQTLNHLAECGDKVFPSKVQICNELFT